MRAFLYWTGFVFFHAFSFLFFPRKILGWENVPKKGGVIVACNHASNLDPFIVGITFLRYVSFMAKDSLFKPKWMGYVMSAWGAFPVKRGRADIGALKEAVRRLKGGAPLVIFPEGTRRKAGAERRILPGVGLIAARSGAPVVPVYIRNSEKLLPPGAKVPRRCPVTVVFGRPQIFDPQLGHEAIARTIVDEIDRLGRALPDASRQS